MRYTFRHLSELAPMPASIRENRMPSTRPVCTAAITRPRLSGRVRPAASGNTIWGTHVPIQITKLRVARTPREGENEAAKRASATPARRYQLIPLLEDWFQILPLWRVTCSPEM